MVDDGRTDDDRPWLYYKLTNEPKGSGELNIHELKAMKRVFKWHVLYEPRREKTCLCHMQTTKVQISLHIRAV